MAINENGAKRKKFSPSDLSSEQQADVVEAYLGIHPRYFLYRGLNIRLNHGKYRSDGNHFSGWKQKNTLRSPNR